MIKKTITYTLAFLPALVFAETPLIVGPEATLYAEDMQKTFATLPAGAPAQLAGSPDKLRKMIDQTYMAKVAATRARATGKDKSPEYQSLLWNYENNNLALIEANAYVAEHMPTDSNVEVIAKERYVANKEKYRAEDVIEAAHIMIQSDAGADDNATLARIQALRADILAGKISFEDAAKQQSADKASAQNGGKLGKFGRGKMVKPFEEVAFAMEKPGDISDPVKTQFGYHLILLESKSVGGTMPYEQVKAKIMEEVRKESASRIREDYWLAIRDDVNVKVNEDQLQQFMKSPTGSDKP